MKINGVIFDLDHTLFDRYKTIEAGSAEFCHRFASYLQPEISEKQVCALLCEADKLFIYYGWKRVFEYLCEKGMFSVIPQYSEYRSCMLDLYSHNAVPFPFTNTLLVTLRDQGYKVGLITNGQSEIQRSKIAMLGIEKYFDAIIVGGEFGIQKPDTAPFTAMARMLNESTENLIYVGDNPINDIDASRNAGYTPIQVLTAQCIVDGYEPAEYQISDVSQLLPILDKLSTK